MNNTEKSGQLSEVTYVEACKIISEGGKVYASPKVVHSSAISGKAQGEDSQELKIYNKDIGCKFLVFKHRAMAGFPVIWEGPYYSNAPVAYTKYYLTHGHWCAEEKEKLEVLAARKIVPIRKDERETLRDSVIQFVDYSHTSGPQGVALRKKFGGSNNQFLIASRDDNPHMDYDAIIGELQSLANSFGHPFHIFPQSLIPNTTTIRFGEYNIYVEDDKQ